MRKRHSLNNTSYRTYLKNNPTNSLDVQRRSMYRDEARKKCNDCFASIINLLTRLIVWVVEYRDSYYLLDNWISISYFKSSKFQPDYPCGTVTKIILQQSNEKTSHKSIHIPLSGRWDQLLQTLGLHVLSGTLDW